MVKTPENIAEGGEENESRERLEAEKLKRLIESDPHTMSLTVAQMALKDIENGSVPSAVARLRTELDKLIITNKELYDYISNYYSAA